MKEKTYTFRHLKYAEAMKGMFTEEQLKNLFIEDILDKGYVPINIAYYQYPTHDRIQAYCAFFGKKEARRRYPEIQKKNFTNIKNPFTPVA